MKMMSPRFLLLAAAMLPLSAMAKTKNSGGSSGKGLPPKFGGLIQPAPAGAGEESKGLISSELSGRDLEFLQNTIELGRLQSYLVKSAEEKAETSEVRSLGGALSEIQADENKYVARLAASKGVVVPNPATPSATQKKVSAELAKLSGAKLEKALMDEIVSAAQKSVNQYEEAMRSSDADIKRCAEQMLPAAKSRLQFASKASGRAPDTSTKPNFRTAPATPRPKSAAAAAGTATPAPRATPGSSSQTAPPPAAAPVPKAVPTPTTLGIPAPPPPRPPKPTPVAEGAVLPKSPTPPDFTAPPAKGK